MTDAHLRILRLVARQRRRALDEHDAAGGGDETSSGGRRRHLERAATRTTVRVAQAQARRRYRPADR